MEQSPLEALRVEVAVLKVQLGHAVDAIKALDEDVKSLRRSLYSLAGGAIVLAFSVIFAASQL